jgi:hypothetical protein
MIADLPVCLFDLPDEILAIVMLWAAQGPDMAKTVASLRGCCARFDAICRTPLFSTSEIDARLVPFARCVAGEYDPTMVSGDSRFVSPTGLVRAPRLRQQFMQTCVRYAIYSLIVAHPGTCVDNRGLHLVPFSSFARQRPPFPLLIHALTRGPHAPDHITMTEYREDPAKVIADDKNTAIMHKPSVVDPDECTQSMINSALIAAAAHAINTTGGLACERETVSESVDLFEAFGDTIKCFRLFGSGFSWQPYRADVTRFTTVDISSIVYPKHWEAIRYRARCSYVPLTDFSFLDKD